MPEKKIVIKINYDADGRNKKVVQAAAKEIVEWKFNRIFGALGVLVLFGVIVFADFGSEETANGSMRPDSNRSEKAVDISIQNDPARQLASVTTLTATNREELENQSGQSRGDRVDENQTSSAESALKQKPSIGRARRWQFTSEMKQREPVDRLNPPFVVDIKNPRILYFFTEMRGLTGHTVTHIWKHNGSVFLKKPFKVDGNRWRMYTSKLLDSEAPGSWEISVVDSSGNSFIQEAFEVKSPTG